MRRKTSWASPLTGSPSEHIHARFTWLQTCAHLSQICAHLCLNPLKSLVRLYYYQQYLAKNPGGYCGLGGTGVSCPVGLGTGTAEESV